MADPEETLKQYGEDPWERGLLFPWARNKQTNEMSAAVPGLIHEPWEAAKRLVSSQYGPGALSTSGDLQPIKDSTEVAAAVMAPSLGLNFAGVMPKNAVGMAGGRTKAGLDMSPAAREERATALGYWPETYYHGTTHRFKEFADPAAHGAPYERESFHGPAIYASSSPSDVRMNYAGIGPDLTNRLERYADAAGFDDIPASAQRLAKRLSNEGVMPDHYQRDPEAAGAWALAYKNLVGKHPEGRTLELRVAPRNPVHVGGEKDTFFPYEHPNYEVRPTKDGEFQVYGPDGKPVRDGKFNVEHQAQDFASEMSFGDSPQGAGAKLLEKIKELGYEHPYAQDQLDQFGTALWESMMDRGGISASRFENFFREHPVQNYLFGEENASPGELLQRMYRELGHDAAVLDNAAGKFPSMGIASGTQHVALFDPTRVRSVDAAFDPKKVGSKNLMSARGIDPITTESILKQYRDREEEGRAQGGMVHLAPEQHDPDDPAWYKAPPTREMTITDETDMPSSKWKPTLPDFGARGESMSPEELWALMNVGGPRRGKFGF